MLAIGMLCNLSPHTFKGVEIQGVSVLQVTGVVLDILPHAPLPEEGIGIEVEPTGCRRGCALP